MAPRLARSATRRVVRAKSEVAFPYYSQTAEFSCGPACALMTLEHFGLERTLTRELEFDVWRETNCIGVRGADPWGLALPLARRGLSTRVIAKLTPTFPMKGMVAFAGRKNAELATWAMRRSRVQARESGVRTLVRAPTFEDVRATLAEGGVPIVLVYAHQAPHWVLAYAMDEKRVYYHDPYLPTGGPGRARTHKQFELLRERAKLRGYTQAIVQVFPGDDARR